MTAGWRGLNMIMLNSRANKFHDASLNSSENATVHAAARTVRLRPGTAST